MKYSPDKVVDLNGTPLCSCGGNKPLAKHSKRSDGGYYYRSVCNSCFKKELAAKHGVKNPIEITARRQGFNSIYEYAKSNAIKAGYSSYTEYTNTFHPYRKHRKDYCENTDGRLGYVCESVIRIPAQLEVDHIDGNPKNNDPSNLQTLCSLCHKYKTLMQKDYSTPGRKKLKAV
jgi:hypothetical protein